MLASALTPFYPDTGLSKGQARISLCYWLLDIKIEKRFPYFLAEKNDFYFLCTSDNNLE